MIQEFVISLGVMLLSLFHPPILTPPTFETVEYLGEIGFGAEYGSSSQVLHRWQDDVKIQVHGDPTEADLLTLDHVVRELDRLIPSISVEITDEHSNVAMHFLPESRLGLVEPYYVPGNLGFFRVWWDEDGTINRGRVLITTQDISQQERSHLIREELTQSLGLFNDSWEYPDSIFYQEWTSTVDYSLLDREVIRLLYSPDLRVGMTQGEFRKVYD